MSMQNLEDDRQPVWVYGAGGHAKVVIEILEAMNSVRIVGVLDDDPAKVGEAFCGYPTFPGGEVVLRVEGSPLVLAVGDNDARRLIAITLEQMEVSFATAVHPTAVVSPSAVIGCGTVIMPNAAVNAHASIGRHAIVNTGTTVDHDCRVGDFAHLSPGVHLGGNVAIGDRTHVGIGAVVANDVSVGAGSIVGAGAAVVADIPAKVVAVGVPARVIRDRNLA